MKKHYSGRTISFLVALLWLMVLGMGAFAVWQLRRMHAEMIRLGRSSVSISMGLTRASQSYMAVSVLGRLGLNQGSGNSAMQRQILSALREKDRAYDQLTSAVVALERAERGLLGAERFSRLGALIAALRDTHREYSGLLTRLMAMDLPKGDDMSGVSQDRLKQTEERIGKLSMQLSEEVADLVEESLAIANFHERVAVVEALSVTAVALLLGIFIVLSISRLRKQALQAERLALLAKMTVTLHHEINNPLAVIIGNSYLLRNGNPSDKERDSIIASIQAMAEQIAEVVRRIGSMEEIVTQQYPGGLEMIAINDAPDTNIATNAPPPQSQSGASSRS